ncbi:hypothetical protein ACA910_004570 [Epithemia clementina (nom. ined.)]
MRRRRRHEVAPPPPPPFNSSSPSQSFSSLWQQQPQSPHSYHHENKITVLITAHPDDESLFFVPTLYGLWQQQQRQQLPLVERQQIWLLCLTTGNYNGLGHERQVELEQVCFGGSRSKINDKGNDDTCGILPMIDKLIVLREPSIHNDTLAMNQADKKPNQRQRDQSNDRRNNPNDMGGWPLDHPRQAWDIPVVASCIQQALGLALLLEEHNDDDDDDIDDNAALRSSSNSHDDDTNQSSDCSPKEEEKENHQDCRSAATATASSQSTRKTIVELITFDQGGVSGHVNHRDTFWAVQRLQQQQQQHWLMLEQQEPEPSRDGSSPWSFHIANVWTLHTQSNVLIKYVPLYEWWLLFWTWLGWIPSWSLSTTTTSNDHGTDHHDNSTEQTQQRMVFRLQQPWRWNWPAMATHASQFVWYRRLFVLFSCYTYMNVLKRHSPQAQELPPAERTFRRQGAATTTTPFRSSVASISATTVPPPLLAVDSVRPTRPDAVLTTGEIVIVHRRQGQGQGQQHSLSPTAHHSPLQQQQSTRTTKRVLVLRLENDGNKK